MNQLPSRHGVSALPVGAWIAVAATAAGAVLFGVSVTQQVGSGAPLGALPAFLMIAAMIFVPQALIVFLLAQRSRTGQQLGAILAALYAVVGLAAGAYWLMGGRITNAGAADSLYLLAPNIVMGFMDAVAAVVAWVRLPAAGPASHGPRTIAPN